MFDPPSEVLLAVLRALCRAGAAQPLHSPRWRVAEGMPSVGHVGSSDAAVSVVGGDLVSAWAGAGGVSVTRLPPGRWRAQVYDPASGKNLSVSRVLGGPGSQDPRPRPSKPASAPGSGSEGLV